MIFDMPARRRPAYWEDPVPSVLTYNGAPCRHQTALTTAQYPKSMGSAIEFRLGLLTPLDSE